MSTSTSEVGRFLLEQGLVADTTEITLEPLTGGVSFEVVAVSAPEGEFVVKRSLPKLKVAVDWPAKVERVFTEVAAMRLLLPWTPAHVPEQVRWVGDYPVVSIEDGCSDEDWGGWTRLTAALGDRIELVGDDLFATTASRVERGVAEGVANAVLVKPNQAGTLMPMGTRSRPVRNLGCPRPPEHYASDAVIACDHSGLEADGIIRTVRVAPAVSTASRRGSCRAIVVLPRGASALDE